MFHGLDGRRSSVFVLAGARGAHPAALRKGKGSARGHAGGQGHGVKGEAVFASCRDAGKGAEQARSGAGGALRAALQIWRHRGKK